VLSRTFIITGRVERFAAHTPSATRLGLCRSSRPTLCLPPVCASVQYFDVFSLSTTSATKPLVALKHVVWRQHDARVLAIIYWGTTIEQHMYHRTSVTEPCRRYLRSNCRSRSPSTSSQQPPSLTPPISTVLTSAPVPPGIYIIIIVIVSRDSYALPIIIVLFYARLKRRTFYICRVLIHYSTIIRHCIIVIILWATSPLQTIVNSTNILFISFPLKCQIIAGNATF